MEDFHRAQWKFYKDRGFKIGTKKTTYGYTAPIAYLTDSREFNHTYNVENFVQQYRGRDEKIIRCDTNQELSLEFFIDFYKTTSEENKKILSKYYSDFSGVKIKDTYMKLCDALCNSSQEKIHFIKKMPFTMFEVKYVDLPEFDKQLQSLGLKDDALHQFYVDFLKPRKNQIKVPSTGAKGKSFLKSKYEEDNINKPGDPLINLTGSLLFKSNPNYEETCQLLMNVQIKDVSKYIPKEYPRLESGEILNPYQISNEVLYSHSYHSPTTFFEIFNEAHEYTEENLINQRSPQKININNLTTGVYYVKIYANKKVYVQRVFITNN